MMFSFLNSAFFEFLILMFIVGNVIILSIVFDEQDQAYSASLDVANLIFTVVFLVEMLLKMAVFGPVKYFDSTWNQYSIIL